MPEYADIYALAPTRSVAAIASFLDHFLPCRIESADEYTIPEYSKTPTARFTSAADLISYCCAHRSEPCSVYWRRNDNSEHAMVFFLADGGMILGVSTPAEDHNRVDAVSNELGPFIGTSEVIVTYEDLPPETMEGFHRQYEYLPMNPDETSRRCRAHRPIKGEQEAGPYGSPAAGPPSGQP